MKKNIFSIILLAVATIFFGCKEVGPAINLEPTGNKLLDTTYLDMNLPVTPHRMVLLEEFTGATCPNCPAGHITTKEILDLHPDSVIVVAIHNDNPQAQPFPGEEDFRTPEGIQISQKLGGSTAIPVAGINRKLFSGESQIAVVRSKWKDYTNQELPVTPKVDVAVTNDFDAASRKLKVRVKLHYLEDVPEQNQLSIMLIENNIMSPQKFQDLSVDPNYLHQHVLRDMITPPFGVATHSTTEKGRVVIKEYEYELPEDWNEAEVEVVALVNLIGSSSYILQSAIEPIQ